MAIWLVRAGRNGEREGYALDHNVAAIGWTQLGDISNVQSREELLARLDAAYPDTKARTKSNWRNQLWQFLRGIQPGDLVALPLKHRPAVAFGRVLGPYRFDPTAPDEARHQLPVEWIKEIARTDINQDLRFTLGAFLTVCRIERNDAEKRFKALIEGKADPIPHFSASAAGSEPDELVATVDLEEASREHIQDLVRARFAGHKMADLVGAVLMAQGYQVTVSPPGADGGVDVIAGTGALGFGNPRIVVQVKSEQGAVDVKVVRELQGVMKQFGADHGLVVAWGGFKNTVIRETARQFFEIRLWSGRELVDQVLEHYEHLPAEIRAELPLKRIWTVAAVDAEA